jgi:cell division protein FtsB
MDRVGKLFLNLSPEPPRNKNPFIISVLLLILAILLFFCLDIFQIYKGVNSYIRNNKSLENLRRELEKFSNENRELESRIIEIKKNYKKKVDTVNSMIEEKSLSWLLLLSIFEESLTDRTVLLSLTPSSREKTFSAEISSESLDELLKTINKLSKNKLVSEVSISSEREKEGLKIFLISMKLKG